LEAPLLVSRTLKSIQHLVPEKRRHDLTVKGAPYMRRWIWRWFGRELRIHHIQAPDPGRSYHDHPFDFVSIVLRGGYVEEVYGDDGSGSPLDCYFLERRRWLAVASRRAETRHRITEVSPGGCWTLVLAGPRRRPWGFSTADGWVPYYDYDYDGDTP